ncbi:hypothetical protein BJ085DRAFT_16820 [Dimargaris cristalligena]|uniref:Uncharacterized protein n=1 Tax=Dimargaris cristalligena TaxID=215637 RepID=A0A4P9ZQT1_9FUNG|nr:hypothetical protein BJ085DRAFT_16820 [Dimargaris cristalligena]|eukprot:RKP35091.1 hypothetical protein BJ085DRAFT_16820 [Dimargaris cristalligena]
MPEITISIKSSNESAFPVTFDPETTTVEQLKAKVAESSDTPPDRQRLIYSGRVLKDHELMSSYKIADSHTIHLVKGSSRAAPPSASVSAGRGDSAASTAAPLGGGASAAQENPLEAYMRSMAMNPPPSMGGAGGGGLPPFGGGFGAGAGAGAGGLPPFMGAGGGAPSMEQMNAIMSDPHYRQMMEQVFSNPQIMESMLNSPQMAGMMTPAMRQMMSDPEFMRSIMDPGFMRGMMALQGLQGMGGGANPNPFGGAGAGGNLYNPWAGTSPNPASPNHRGNDPSAALANNPFLALLNPALAAGFNPGSGAAMGTSPNPAATQEPPEVRFQVQLQQLNEMGFYDASQNIRALLASGGDVNAALEYLFAQHP